MAELPVVVVRRSDGTLYEMYTIVKPDGSPAPYDGPARRAAFKRAFGRDGSDDEIVEQTFPLSLDEVTVS